MSGVSRYGQEHGNPHPTGKVAVLIVGHLGLGTGC